MVFVIGNWFALTGSTSLAPPDFYQYFSISEKFFHGDFTNFHVPPLFPILLGATGNILQLFFRSFDTFILGGEIISLLASLGVIYFVYRFFHKIIGEFSALAALSLTLFPFFLKFLSLPITDILYLFFVISSFYLFFEGRLLKSIFVVLLAFFTRFEAILLVFSIAVNFLTGKKKNIKTILFSVLIFLSAVSVYIAFSKRFLKKIEFVVLNKSFLYFLLHPLKLADLFYFNIAFFVPEKIPGFCKVIIFLIALGFLIYGYKVLYKVSRRLAFSIILYQVLFIVSKGYIIGVGNVFNPGMQSRRMLSVIFLLWFVTAIGVVGFFKNRRNYFSNLWRAGTEIFLVIISFILFYTNLRYLRKLPVVLFMIFVVVLVFILYKSNFQKKRIVGFFLISVLFLSVYPKGYNQSIKYASSLSNRGAYMIAVWINANLKKNEKLVSYTAHTTVDYYLNKKIKKLKVLIKDKEIYENPKRLQKALWKKLKRKKIKHVCFDLYMNPIDNPMVGAIKKMLYRSRKQKEYFKLKKYLHYKGKIVAYVMEVL